MSTQPSTLLDAFHTDKSFNQSESTADTYVGNLNSFIEWWNAQHDKHPKEATKREIQQYLNHCKKRGLANKTIALKHTSIQQFYKWLVSEGEIKESPTKNLESGVDTSVSKKQQEIRSDKPPAVTEKEKELLCENVPDPKVRNELLIRLMFQTGIRTKELRNIRIQDLDRNNRSIKVEDAKSNKYRTVFYNDLEPWLSQWLDQGYRDSLRPASDSPYLFITNRKERFSINTASRVITEAADNAEIQETMYEDNNGGERKRITPHALRHGFARSCVKDGMDISYLKELMGHENLDVTKQYLKFTDQDKRDAVRKHGPSPK